MLRFAASLTMMFTEVPVLDRFMAAKAAGFEAVEMQNPYEAPAPRLAEALAASGLEMLLINTPTGDTDGDRGLAAVPGRERDFEIAFARTLDYARALGAGMIHVLAGNRPPGTAPDAADRTFVANLRQALAASAGTGVQLLIEPLNPHDFPGYHVSTYGHAVRLIETVGDPRVGLQLDLYHRQRSEGEVEGAIRAYLPIARHIQIAGAPRRTEPDIGEMNYAHLFGVIEELGYRGWIGCEYRPVAGTVAGLAWLRRLKSEADAFHGR